MQICICVWGVCVWSYATRDDNALHKTHSLSNKNKSIRYEETSFPVIRGVQETSQAILVAVIARDWLLEFEG